MDHVPARRCLQCVETYPSPRSHAVVRVVCPGGLAVVAVVLTADMVKGFRNGLPS